VFKTERSCSIFAKACSILGLACLFAPSIINAFFASNEILQTLHNKFTRPHTHAYRRIGLFFVHHIISLSAILLFYFVTQQQTAETDEGGRKRATATATATITHNTADWKEPKERYTTEDGRTFNCDCRLRLRPTTTATVWLLPHDFLLYNSKP
jgi:hypothetical protein